MARSIVDSSRVFCPRSLHCLHHLIQLISANAQATDTIHLHSVSSLTLSIVVPACSCTDTTDTYRTQRLDAWPYMCAWSQVLYIAQEEAMPPTSTGAQMAQLHVVTIKVCRQMIQCNDRQKGNSIIPTWTRLFWQLL